MWQSLLAEIHSFGVDFYIEWVFEMLSMELCPHRGSLYRQHFAYGGNFKRGRVVVGDDSFDGFAVAFNGDFVDYTSQ